MFLVLKKDNLQYFCRLIFIITFDKKKSNLYVILRNFEGCTLFHYNIKRFLLLEKLPKPRLKRYSFDILSDFFTFCLSKSFLIVKNSYSANPNKPFLLLELFLDIDSFYINMFLYLLKKQFKSKNRYYNLLGFRPINRTPHGFIRKRKIRRV